MDRNIQLDADHWRSRTRTASVTRVLTGRELSMKPVVVRQLTVRFVNPDHFVEIEVDAVIADAAN